MTSPAVTGVLLAGGLSRRMGGGDKALLELGGRPILDHVIERIAPQAGELILNANGDPARFRQYGLPVVADPVEGYAGPLAGVLAGMQWTAKNRPDRPWIVTVASDTPFLPLDLVARLFAAADREGADLACAASGGRHHPVFGLWPVALRDDLERAMLEDDIRKVDRWTARHKLAVAGFESEPVDPFFNANRPGDLATAQSHLEKSAS